MTKNEIKFIQELTEKKNRTDAGLFVVEGPKMIEELLKSSFSVEKIYLTEQTDSIPENISTEFITTAEMRKISQFKTPSSLLALVRIPQQTTTFPLDKWIIALDNLQDPGNMGTIIRIADWFGISHIIATPESADCYNSKVIQATMGGIFRVTVSYLPLEPFLSETKIPIYGALLEGKNIFQQKKLQPGILIIGNESKGISPKIQAFIKTPLTIPRIGNAESLNAAVATGILTALLTAE